MTPNVQVGTILIEDRPLVTRILDLGSESYSAKWVVLKVPRLGGGFPGPSVKIF